jgi:hypothetical protein
MTTRWASNSQAPVFGFRRRGFGRKGGPQAATGRPSGRGAANDPDIPQGRPRDIGVKSVEEFRKTQKEKPQEETRPGAPTGPRPRTIMSFSRNANDLLISGGLAAGEELAGAPALLDATLGNGHVVMFSFNPMWRHQTHGSFSLVSNAMLNFKNLGPAVPAAK